MKPIPELKPIACKVRTLGWKPTITIRQPGGTLTFQNDEHRPGLFAYGKRHDYWLHIDRGMGYVGRFAEEELYSGMPDPERSDCWAVVPDATTNELIRIAERWENQ